MLIPGRSFRLIENLNVSRGYATGTESSVCLIGSLLGNSVCEVCVCARHLVNPLLVYIYFLLRKKTCSS